MINAMATFDKNGVVRLGEHLDDDHELELSRRQDGTHVLTISAGDDVLCFRLKDRNEVETLGWVLVRLADGGGTT